MGSGLPFATGLFVGLVLKGILLGVLLFGLGQHTLRRPRLPEHRRQGGGRGFDLRRPTAFLEKGEPFRESSPQHSVSTKGFVPCASQPVGPSSLRTALVAIGIEAIVYFIGP